MHSKDVSLASKFKQIKDDISARVLEDLNTYIIFLSSSVYVVPHWLQ